MSTATTTATASPSPATTIRPGESARLQGLEARSDLNCQIVHVVRYVPEAGRWKCQLPNQYGAEPEYIGVRETKLRPCQDVVKFMMYPTMMPDGQVGNTTDEYKFADLREQLLLLTGPAYGFALDNPKDWRRTMADHGLYFAFAKNMVGQKAPFALDVVSVEEFSRVADFYATQGLVCDKHPPKALPFNRYFCFHGAKMNPANPPTVEYFQFYNPKNYDDHDPRQAMLSAVLTDTAGTSPTMFLYAKLKIPY